MKMKLNSENGKLFLDKNDLTPPSILNDYWETELLKIFPLLKKHSQDYQKWMMYEYRIKSVYVNNKFGINFGFFYNQNLEIDKIPKFRALSIRFCNDFLNNEVFKDKKLKYDEKLKKVKSTYILLLESLTEKKFDIGNGNDFLISPVIHTRLSRKKGAFYELNIVINNNK